jgi:hypothetical protein
MNRRIPNDTWCIWKTNPNRTRKNAVVIATHPDIDDTDFVGRDAVKVYACANVIDPDGFRGDGLPVGVRAMAPAVLAQPVPEAFDRIEFR